jgi:hypothetical protein
MHYESENCVTTKGRKEHTRKRPLESQQSAASVQAAHTAECRQASGKPLMTENLRA